MVGEVIDPFRKKDEADYITKVKRKKLWKLSGKVDIKELVSDRITEHLGLFTFFDNFYKLYEGKFVSPNVINLPKRHLSKNEIFLLSIGPKFIPIPKHINKALIKEKLETYGRKLRLMWHYCNEEREIIISHFKKKSIFNPKQKEPAIEIYLGLLEEEIFSLEKKLSARI